MNRIPPDRSTFLILLNLVALAVGGLTIAIAGNLPLKNPGFEESDAGWSQPVLQTRGVAFLSEAAKTGNLGARITDTDPASDVTLSADPVPAEPGKTYRVSFAGRVVSGDRGLNVFVRFLDKDQRPIALPDGHRYHFMLVEEHREWGRHSFDAVSPEGTAFAEVYIRTNKRAVIEADVDDIAIELLP